MIWRLSAISNGAAATGISTRYGYVLSFVSGLPRPKVRHAAAVFMERPLPHAQGRNSADYVSKAWPREKLSTGRREAAAHSLLFVFGRC